MRAGWRPVVTAFVQRGDGRVLVVRRSSQVSTYQGMWGGVSGGVEASDTSLADRAFAEVRATVAAARGCATRGACNQVSQLATEQTHHT